MKEFAEAIIYFLPAYLSNALPVFYFYFSSKGILPDAPLDRGIIWKDGKRLLGDGRSLAGIPLHLLGGLLGGLVLFFASGWGFGFFMSLGFLEGLGALVASIMMSFLKRRIGIEWGQKAGLSFIADWVNYIVGAAIFAAVITLKPLQLLPWALAITLILHPIAAVVGFKVGVKKGPW